MTNPPTSDAAGAVLPDWLLSLIGDYGFASRNESTIQAMHRWELLIAGIKRYASTPQPPPEAGSVVPDGRTIILSRQTSFLGFWDSTQKAWCDNRQFFRDPTHWMPLPEPPK